MYFLAWITSIDITTWWAFMIASLLNLLPSSSSKSASIPISGRTCHETSFLFILQEIGVWAEYRDIDSS